MDELWLTLRLMCVSGCLATLWFLASSRFRQWDHWNSKTKDHWYALTGWAFFGLYATVESLAMDTPGGSRIIVLGLVIAFTFRALLNRGDIKAEGGPPWKGNQHDSR